MDTPLHEEYWAQAYWVGVKGQPAFRFTIDFQNVPLYATEQVRASVEQLLREHGAGRPLVRNTAKAIADLCSIRLAHEPNWAPATRYLVFVPWDQADTEGQVLGDRSLSLAWALRMADEPGEAAYVWGVIAEGFELGPSGGLPESLQAA